MLICNMHEFDYSTFIGIFFNMQDAYDGGGGDFIFIPAHRGESGDTASRYVQLRKQYHHIWWFSFLFFVCAPFKPVLHDRLSGLTYFLLAIFSKESKSSGMDRKRKMRVMWNASMTTRQCCRFIRSMYIESNWSTSTLYLPPPLIISHSCPFSVFHLLSLPGVSSFFYDFSIRHVVLLVCCARARIHRLLFHFIWLALFSMNVSHKKRANSEPNLRRNMFFFYMSHVAFTSVYAVIE